MLSTKLAVIHFSKEERFFSEVQILTKFNTDTLRKNTKTKNYANTILMHQGGITCGAIEEARKSSKGIDDNNQFSRQKCQNCAVLRQK